MITTHEDIDAACHQARIDPIDLLCTLLAGLEYRHRTYRQSWNPSIGPEAGLFIVVSDLMEMENTDESPVSLLAAVELHLRIRARRERDDRAVQLVWRVARGYLEKADHREAH
jgi:hypothetical protein